MIGRDRSDFRRAPWAPCQKSDRFGVQSGPECASRGRWPWFWCWTIGNLLVLPPDRRRTGRFLGIGRWPRCPKNAQFSFSTGRLGPPLPLPPTGGARLAACVATANRGARWAACVATANRRRQWGRLCHYCQPAAPVGPPVPLLPIGGARYAACATTANQRRPLGRLCSYWQPAPP